MKKYRIIAIILCVVLLISSFPTQTSAFERTGHDAYLEEVLFKNFKVIENDPSVKNEIHALESACYLTVDQFNSNGQKDLELLRAYNVKGLPNSISDISFNASGKTHRSYTHRGWDYVASGMKEKWPIRQQILLNTVDKVFDFNGDEAKKENFAKLLYYIHILGDHTDDTSYMLENGLKMDVGGRKDKYDIIHELLDVFKVLFKDQKHTHKYRSLTSNLEQINSKYSKLIGSEGGINSDEEFQLHQKYLEDVMDILTYYIPEMLKDEMFFAEVFYKK